LLDETRIGAVEPDHDDLGRGDGRERVEEKQSEGAERWTEIESRRQRSDQARWPLEIRERSQSREI
jgi:hypothetical protein